MNDCEIFNHFLNRLMEYPVVKIVTGFFIWLLQLLFGSIFRPVYGVVLILWLTDTMTGYYHARVNPAVIPDSRRMYHGLVKVTIYYFLLFLGYQCSRLYLTTFVQAIIESFIILTEVYSICENVQKIAALKGVQIPIIDRIMALVQGKINNTKG